MEFFAYDYEGNKKTGKAFCEFDYLRVDVLSGDEYVYAYKNGSAGEQPTCVGYVSGGSMVYMGYAYEGSYYVNRNDIAKWLKRSDSYCWLHKKPYEDLETSDE